MLVLPPPDDLVDPHCPCDRLQTPDVQNDGGCQFLHAPQHFSFVRVGYLVLGMLIRPVEMIAEYRKKLSIIKYNYKTLQNIGNYYFTLKQIIPH